MGAADPASCTLRDVAARAGVSVATVSRVVNGHPSVRPATRERVERAIHDLGYVPNGDARRLALSQARKGGPVRDDAVVESAPTDLRPVVHFTPPRGWLNDPNGLVSAGGLHHLFYQHFPGAPDLGPMHWGHAVTRDFVTWEHRPIALEPDELGTIISGSAVVDADDTAGFGPGALVAAFTYHTDDGQSQALASSVDGGETFTKYVGNPVIPIAADRPMSRDPKVVWFGDDAGGHWVMALAAHREVRFFASGNLRTWRPTGVFDGFDVVEGGTVDGDVETPELFPLTADDGELRWVLSVGLSRGGPAGGCGTAAVLGEFDGGSFRPLGTPTWVDHGRHFYAAQSWNGLPGRRVWIGWMGNWADDRDRPHPVPWRGQMSIPREVTLRGRNGSYRLVQRPVPELLAPRRAPYVEDGLVLTAAPHRPRVSGRALDIDLAWRDRDAAGLEVVCARGATRVAVSLRDRSVRVAGATIRDAPAAEFVADVGEAESDRLELRLVLDVGSIELWCGSAAISALLPCGAESWSVELSTDGRDVRLDRLAVASLGEHAPCTS